MIYIDMNIPVLTQSHTAQIEGILKREFRVSKNGALSACAWMLLKYALEKEYAFGIEAMEIREGDHGKPYFINTAGIEFNLSHSHNVAAAALCRLPVGIDVQKIMPYNEKLANRICNGDELNLLAQSDDKAKTLCCLWALKESYVKYTGEGMTSNFKEIPYHPLAKIFTLSNDYVLAVCYKETVDVIHVTHDKYLWMLNTEEK